MCHQKNPQKSMANLSVYHCPWPPFRAVQRTLALGGSPVVPQRSKRDKLHDKLAPRHSAEGYPSQPYNQVNLARQDLLPIRLQHNLQLVAHNRVEVCDNITIYALCKVNALKPYCGYAQRAPDAVFENDNLERSTHNTACSLLVEGRHTVKP